MRITKKVRVGPFNYTVIREDINNHRVDADEFLYGYTDHRKRLIALDTSLSKSELEETFMHELGECIKYVYMQEFDLPHALLTQNAIGWHQVLKDNGFLKEK